MFSALGLVLASGCGDSTGGTGDASGTQDTNDDSGISPSTTADDLTCLPGQISCADQTTIRICNPDGETYTEVPCDAKKSCDTGKCLGPCEFAEETPSSFGCSFIAARVKHYRENSPDALILGNTDPDDTATVKLWHVPDNIRTEMLLDGPVELKPGETLLFEMTNGFVSDTGSGFRTGGVYRVESDIPIVAYQHAPLENSTSNDSSMLLPQHTLGTEYIVYSYPGFQDRNVSNVHGRPSYFTVIALDNETTVQWTPKAKTKGDGLAFKDVYAGNTGEKLMNKYDFIQVAADDDYDDYWVLDQSDVSGTVVTADKPIWVVGATNCAFVPYKHPFNPDTTGWGFCDHLQEQLIPVEQWGKTYVGIHAPVRKEEFHFWRVYAGEDNTDIWVFPQIPKYTANPIRLAKKGDWFEFAVDPGTSLLFHGSEPFMPVQYIAGSREGSGNIGDPAMYAMVPVEQYLKRYVFTTGSNYGFNYVQIARKKGGADVFVDGQLVSGYETLAKGDGVSGFELDEYEVVNWEVSDGAHSVVSDDPVGITNVGYADPEASDDNGYASYAYPGGMALEVINPG